MNFKEMMNAGVMTIRKYSPEILVVSGVAGVVASAVMACRATRKLDGILDAHQENVECAHQKFAALAMDAAAETTSEEEAKTGLGNAEKQALTKVYVQTGLALGKLYGPAFTLGTLSVASILAGSNILRKRNVALAAAYAAIDTSFKQYRGRVVEKYGQEVDNALRIGSHQEKIETVETDENGKRKKVKKSVTVVDDPMPSDYARYFCFGEARAAEPNEEYNLFFLKAQQNLANHLLMTNGFLFLNDVYEMLGIDRSEAGQAVGWVYDKNCDAHGDNYVDFGIQEVYRKRSDQPGDYEKVFLLDFNVDGSIMNHTLKKGLMTK